jgi:hypothetical protein
LNCSTAAVLPPGRDHAVKEPPGALDESGELKNAEILIYLNRRSDFPWRFARWVETKARRTVGGFLRVSG